MLLPSILVNALKIGFWPVWLRKSVVLSMIRRKRIGSLPFHSTCHGFKFEGDACNLVDYHVLSRGAFEPGLTALLNDWAGAGNDGVLLDVGANVGVHILGCCRAYPKVIGMEPFPLVADRLEHALQANGIENVTIKRQALAEKGGKTWFKVPESSNLGTGRILDGPPQEEGADDLEVDLTTGDAIMAEEKSPLSAVKIDTEGAEQRVLAGMSDTLDRDRPLVVFELLGSDGELAETLRGLFPKDYRFYLLGNIKTPRFTLTPWSKGAGDIVAVPSEKADKLEGHVI